MSHFALWHVHYDGQPGIVGHVCEQTRKIGAALECPSGDPADGEGNCAHVQLRRCDCQTPELCAEDHSQLEGLSPKQIVEKFLDEEVRAEISRGNVPPCFTCRRTDQVGYMGIVTGSPTFTCARCSAVYAMDLTEA